ncbi:MAG: SDR family oxidoreductase [Pseudohaliea sp.]
MLPIDAVEASLRERPAGWLVTGCAGFIGSHLASRLLSLGQRVVGLDNFATGHEANLDEVRARAPAGAEFRFVAGDIRNLDACRAAVDGVDYVLHEAALGSVPRSMDDPLATNAVNVDGFLNVLVAARDAGVRRTVYAASSATYGDEPGLPKVEDRIGEPLSPYAVSKTVNELYAGVFARAYGLETIGLRYFNVFGPRQDPEGAYAAVIPRWFGELMAGKRCRINGDGETSRDFCHVDNVVQANLLAATTGREDAINTVYNIAYGSRTTLNELYGAIRDAVAKARPEVAEFTVDYGPFREGDVRHSLADTERARERLGYAPTVDVPRGLTATAEWFIAEAQREKSGDS